MDSSERPPSGTRLAAAAADAALPLRLLLRFADAGHERRFVAHYVAFYLRYAQSSLVLGIGLIVGDWAVETLANGGGPANLMRLTTAVPVLLGALAYSLLPDSRRHWQPVMAGIIVATGVCLVVVLVRLDAEGGGGLKSWVGALNFTFLAFYCFVILGVQFRYALPAGLAILAAFLYALAAHAGLSAREAAYASYHLVTVFVLPAAIGWWREYVLRKEYAARSALDDSRIAAEQRAVQLAHYDETTGLPNRRLFAELAARALQRAGDADGPARCALLHVAIDRLDGIADVYGRDACDAVLAEMGQRLRACIRRDDLAVADAAPRRHGVVARLGDSAFSVVVTDLDGQEGASRVARRLLKALGEPVLVDAKPLVPTASVGIAMFPGDAADLAGLARCAEQAARTAAEAGGARHRFFDEALDARARDRMVLEAELRDAIPGGQLRLHHQPKFDARSGAIVGAEALVRWQHPERGLLSPGVFIPMAEESGLIEPLTDWVLDAACSSLRRWADAGLPALPLSVNLPAVSLADAALVQRLAALLERHALPPSSLVLELTETVLMHDVAAAVAVMKRLRAIGFRLSLDDFGTGYSSLSYLRKLPIDELKIDRAFIVDVARAGRDRALAAAIITLCAELGLQVVAEGVETAEQSQFLLGQGCAVQQGFLFSRPLPQAEFERLLGTRGVAAEA